MQISEPVSQKFKNAQILYVNFSQYHQKEQNLRSSLNSLSIWFCNFRSLLLSGDLRKAFQHSIVENLCKMHVPFSYS